MQLEWPLYFATAKTEGTEHPLRKAARQSLGKENGRLFQSNLYLLALDGGDVVRIWCIQLHRLNYCSRLLDLGSLAFYSQVV